MLKFDEISRNIPHITLISPAGEDSMMDLHLAGGIQAVLKTLGDKIDTKPLTVTGKTIGARNHVMVFPNSHYVTTRDKMDRALITIEEEMEERVREILLFFLFFVPKKWYNFE